MNIQKIVLLMSLCCVSYAMHAKLIIKNNSSMNLQLYSFDTGTQELLPGGETVFMETPKSLAIREKKQYSAWLPLWTYLLKIWGQKNYHINPVEGYYKTTGYLVIHDSTSDHPLLWNIEAYADRDRPKKHN